MPPKNKKRPSSRRDGQREQPTADTLVQPRQEDTRRLLELFQSGQLAEAESMAQQLCQRYPRAATPLNVLGLTLARKGMLDQAISCFRQVLKIQPDFHIAHFNLGNALKELGSLREALASYRRALKSHAGLAELHSNMAGIFLDTGRFREAATSSQKAIKIKPRMAVAHYNLGTALMHCGRHQEAIASFKQALEIDPRSYMSHNNLGITYRLLGEAEKAVSSFSAAVKLAPDHASAHANLGHALNDLGRFDDAAACFRKALGIRPDSFGVRFSLASVLEKTNRLDELRQIVEEAGRYGGSDPRLAYMQALVIRRDGDYGTARKVLESARPAAANAKYKAARAYLLSELCDRQGDADAAFAYASQANRECVSTPEASRYPPRAYLARVDRLTKRFSREWVAQWQPAAVPQDRAAPVFMIGFPRSGTTLLDTILRTHPDLAVVEEASGVRPVVDALDALFGGDADGLSRLTAADLAALRETYFAELDRHLKPDRRGRTVIDKLPLNTINAGLIHRIFPEARFLFVQRHPCDCVLSCFMQWFRLNHAMVNFLDLNQTARTYDKVMKLWQQYCAVLPLQVHIVRYERLVEAFDETLGPALGFLGVDWHDGVRNYSETARRRSRINTPSYSQVTEPLYTRAIGRWKRYSKHLEPVLPMLLPWAEQFGYLNEAAQPAADVAAITDQ